MKRLFASLICGITLLSYATPVLARSTNATRWSQARPSRRFIKQDALSYNRTRSREVARARYFDRIQRVVRSFPSRLAITGGGRNHADFQTPARPSKRATKGWTLPSHCRMDSRRCGN